MADLEFAFAGGVCVGHRTGGLGKVPGYYFAEGLDNTIVLSGGLQRAMEQAMQASWDEVRKLAEAAAGKEFPPEEQVQRYNAVRMSAVCDHYPTSPPLPSGVERDPLCLQQAHGTLCKEQTATAKRA